MTYTPVDWTDGVTPVNAANLDHIEQGIDDVDSRLTVIETTPQGAELTYEGDYAGATTYQDGDVVMKDGVAFLCVGGPTTVAPNLAPWGSQAGLGTLGELAYAERTTILSLTGSPQTVVTAPPISCNGITPVVIDFFAPYVTAPSPQILFSLHQDGVDIGYLAADFLSVGNNIPIRVTRRLTPSAGSHTYSIVGVGAGGSVGAAPGGAGVWSPAFIRVSLAAPILIPSAGALTPVTYGTSLPVGPTDGQEAILVDNVANPSYQWRFRYNASSTSPYKWEFVGGAPRVVGPAGSGTQSAAETWVPISGGPTIVVPRTGEYHFSANVRAQAYAFTAAYDSNARFRGTTKGAMGQWYLMTHTAVYTGGRALMEETQVLTAGETLSLEWKTNLATTTAVDYATLSLNPLRVS